jgi:hypothetical protein
MGKKLDFNTDELGDFISHQKIFSSEQLLLTEG